MTIFFAADHHFSHSRVWRDFKRQDGSPLRDFSSNEEHDEYIISQHNKRVGAKDVIYILGDVVFRQENLHLVGRMNGRKILIKGNHDNSNCLEYLKYFEDIRAIHTLKGVVMSHVPLHPQCLPRWGINIHGHLHNYVIRDKYGLADERYFNVSMERLIDYTPVSLEEIKLRRNHMFDEHGKINLKYFD